ncbi:exosome complex protein LRP1 [Coccidioides immitis RS]|uniref:Exosome complex protein n=2 Tax=Coccidioides immitis TaxID=5501 RepID=A0A0E1S4F3_COCIM|nr:exosome complex protein LRP1 [Coccidioides immitis RS]EAS35076.1 exosome complex protein LRP1 [Coccidioides immitis RS]
MHNSAAMEMTDLTPLGDQLEGDIDELEEVLEPLLSQTLSTATQKMTVMDKAKLHVLITYTIESLLFSYLRLQGVNAKEHSVFKELTRVKQYFAKIKNLETVPEKPTMTLDKQAAARFIKHGLAGNDKIDLERAEREAKERAMAQLRAAQLARKQGETVTAATPADSLPQKRPAEDEEESENDDGDTGNEYEASSNTGEGDHEVTAHPNREPGKKRNRASKRTRERRRGQGRSDVADVEKRSLNKEKTRREKKRMKRPRKQKKNKPQD